MASTAFKLGTKFVSVFPGYAEGVLEQHRSLIMSAGDVDIEPETLLGRRVFGIFLMPAFIFFIAYNVPMLSFVFGGPHTLIFTAALAYFGYCFPKLNFEEKIQKRQKEVIIQLPDMIDLLAVCVEAGMDFLSALRVVVANQKEGPLREEFERFLKRLELGVPRVDALRELSDRINVSDMRSVCSVLAQAARLGSPLGPILKTQASILRTRRGQRAEKAAAEATVKVLMPLALCIFPAAFIAILGPVILQIMENLGR